MKRWWLLAFALAATMLVAFFAVSSAGIKVLEDPSEAMRATRPAAAAIGVLLLVADVVLPVPSSLVMVAHGALFGVFGGTLLSLLGSVASACTGFAIGRAGNNAIRRFVTEREHERAGAMLQRWGLVAVAVSRPIPILAETVAILAGSSPVTWARFTLAAFSGSIVPAAAYAWAGAHAQGFVMQSVIFAGVIAAGALLMLVSRRLAPPAAANRG
ncbi:MAG: VTT domain-containing protein [Acidobacteriota bacterium]|nr:VTT domain-containing protein [Acidobacteriota bacterium]